MQKSLAAARTFAVSLASGVLVFGAGKAASAQGLDSAPWSAPASEAGISLRAQIDVMFQPEGGGPPILMQKTFETGASGQNMSSEYVFEILNGAALAGLDQALAKGAKAGRVNVVAVCYAYGLSETGLSSLTPMGVFINTTKMDVLPDGKAAFHTNLKFIPPFGVQSPPEAAEADPADAFEVVPP